MQLRLPDRFSFFVLFCGACRDMTWAPAFKAGSPDLVSQPREARARAWWASKWPAASRVTAAPRCKGRWRTNFLGPEVRFHVVGGRPPFGAPFPSKPIFWFPNSRRRKLPLFAGSNALSLAQVTSLGNPLFGMATTQPHTGPNV